MKDNVGTGKGSERPTLNKAQTALHTPDSAVNPPFLARDILATFGINAAWSPDALRVSVVARLPKSDDRKLFNMAADNCGTHAELVELAARTLKAFEKRRTPLRPPPPLGEDGSNDRVRDEETSSDSQSPYTVR